MTPSVKTPIVRKIVSDRTVDNLWPRPDFLCASALTVPQCGAICLRPSQGKIFLFFGAIVANTHSAEKQNRKSQKNRTRNAHVMSTLRSSVRKFREAAASGNKDRTKQELAFAVRQIAKAASKGVIHKGQAARRISRLTKAATGAPQVQAKT